MTDVTSGYGDGRSGRDDPEENDSGDKHDARASSEPETSDSLKAFGEVLKAFRLRAGLTQEECCQPSQPHTCTADQAHAYTGRRHRKARPRFGT